MASLVRVIDPVLALVFPARCPACADPVERPLRGPLCERCWERLPRHRGAACACGTILPENAAPPCGRCRRGLSHFDAGASLGPYEGPLKILVQELKFKGRQRVSGRLAELLWEEAPVRALFDSGAVVVPVPLHPQRRRHRGYNQAELIATALARRARAPVEKDALARRKETAPQTGLSAAGRRRNVAGAFVVRRRARIHGRKIVLVDDVCTTGATSRACAAALRQAGARAVRLLTVARVAR